MHELTAKSSLCESERWLVELMQKLNFGRIQTLRITRGKPVPESSPQVIQKVKIGAENGARPESGHDDFLLKRQAVEMFDAFHALGDGMVVALEVKHGLPFSLEIEMPAIGGTNHA